MIADFSEIFKNTVRGKYERRKHSSLITKNLEGGAKIRMVFNQLLANFTSYKAASEYTDVEIREAIKIHGETIPGFPSADAFVYLLQP
mmetsp:Transcript_6879/g.3838  ORF Transcript_6879/g.3838 Transcript_6879/m.3838 type:complete len:88 (-) Transcript_6879:777-1040(-)